MKNLLVALAIVLGLCLQSGVAQTTAPPPASDKMKAEVAEKVRAELMKIDKELQLTEEQVAQLKAILTDEKVKLQAAYSKIEPEVLAIQSESRGKMRDVLTPDQKKKWDNMKEMKAEYGKKLEPVKSPN